MRAGLIILCCSYILSQFFRAFLAVLSTVLEQDIGAGPDDLALASGLWFITFAALQIPIGAALDRFGPRRTASWMLFVGGGGGAVLFAMASTPMHINAAMCLIGLGCSPVLMASYFIFRATIPGKPVCNAWCAHGGRRICRKSGCSLSHGLGGRDYRLANVFDGPRRSFDCCCDRNQPVGQRPAAN